MMAFLFFIAFPRKKKPTNQPTNRRANETRSVNCLSSLPSHASFLFSFSFFHNAIASSNRNSNEELKSQNVCVDVITQQQKRLKLEKGQERKSEKKPKWESTIVIHFKCHTTLRMDAGASASAHKTFAPLAAQRIHIGAEPRTTSEPESLSRALDLAYLAVFFYEYYDYYACIHILFLNLFTNRNCLI